MKSKHKVVIQAEHNSGTNAHALSNICPQFNIITAVIALSGDGECGLTAAYRRTRGPSQSVLPRSRRPLGAFLIHSSREPVKTPAMAVPRRQHHKQSHFVSVLTPRLL